jgi:hypothetical protein
MMCGRRNDLAVFIFGRTVFVTQSHCCTTQAVLAFQGILLELSQNIWQSKVITYTYTTFCDTYILLPAGATTAEHTPCRQKVIMPGQGACEAQDITGIIAFRGGMTFVW